MAEAKKPGKDVVYLDVDDDITTVVHKVTDAKDKIVALVLPKRFATLQSIVNMRLLHRSAKSADKNVVLITSEEALLPLAGAAGIHVAKNLQSKPVIPPSPVDAPDEKPVEPDELDGEIDEKDAKLDYHRSIGVLAATHAVDEPETIPLDDEEEEEGKKPAKKPAKDKKLNVPNFDRFRLGMIAAIAGGILLIIFLIMAIFVWPKATITLQTEATPVSASFNLTTSAKATVLDEATNTIPAASKTSDLTSNQQAQATGQKNNGQKATGSVTISNCTNSPVTIPAGTGLTQGGLAYITQSTLALDSGNFTSGGSCKSSGSHVGSTNIVAQQGGTKYNVSGATFTVKTDVAGSGSASGGTDNVITILSQGDVDAAKNKVSDSDKNKFADTFKKQLSDQGYYIIDSTFKAAEPVVTSSPAVGEQASTANVTVKITYSALVVKSDDLKKAVTDELNKQIDLKKQKIVEGDVLKGTTVEVESQKSPTEATLSISKNTSAVPILNIASIKSLTAGQKAGIIKSMLSSYPGVKDVEVKMSPFWVSKAPKKPSHIVIIQKQAANSKP